MKIIDIEKRASDLFDQKATEKKRVETKVQEVETRKIVLQKQADEQANTKDIEGYANTMAEIRKCDDMIDLCGKIFKPSPEQIKENTMKAEDFLKEAKTVFKKETASDWADCMKYVNKAYEIAEGIRKKQERTQSAVDVVYTAYGVRTSSHAVPTSFGLINQIGHLKKNLGEREKYEKEGILL